jgi:hypothetical protein
VAGDPLRVDRVGLPLVPGADRRAGWQREAEDVEDPEGHSGRIGRQVLVTHRRALIGQPVITHTGVGPVWLAGFDPALIRERWQGVYVISYLAGEPARLHFTGFSGD